MAEISVQFSNKLNGYDKSEVNEYVRQAESRLQEKSIALANTQQQVEELVARLNKITSADASVEEKVELYDKLMKKMDGDYTNLLAPAIAKAKSIEAQAEKEYAIRIDQARYTAEGIYTETADRIANVLDANMDRFYGLLEDYIDSKSVPGYIHMFFRKCKSALGVAAAVPVRAAGKVKAAAERRKEQKKAKASEDAVLSDAVEEVIEDAIAE
ncbi:MAG: hypothetical protein E7643_06550 [Ruminococcaceae bacterium]|nr:hypothetical protein [Oscillospiraceae bacterium]